MAFPGKKLASRIIGPRRFMRPFLRSVPKSKTPAFEFPEEEGSWGPPRKRPVGTAAGIAAANFVNGIRVISEFIGLAFISFVTAEDMFNIRGPNGALARMALALGIIITLLMVGYVFTSGVGVFSVSFLLWQLVRFLIWIGSW